MPTTKKSRKSDHGGARRHSGRPPKIDKEKFGQITCVLRQDTIDRLREGADSRRFGEFLQDHLDRYPLPTRENYLALLRRGVPIHRPREKKPWERDNLSRTKSFPHGLLARKKRPTRSNSNAAKIYARWG